MPSFRTVITVWGANGIPGKKILLLSVGVSQIGLASVCGKVDSVSSEPAHFPTCKVKMKVVPDSLLSHGLYSPPGSSVHGILQAEYWNGLPFPFPEDLPNPGIELRSPTLQADPLLSEPPGKPSYMENLQILF